MATEAAGSPAASARMCSSIRESISSWVMSFSEVVRSPYGYSTATVRIMSRPLHSDFGPPAIGGLLRLAWEEHRRRMYDCVVTGGFHEVTPAQFEVFRFPGVDGMRPGEVAELTGLSKQ